MNSNNRKHFDVIILGSGLAGSILATILARHSTRVLIVDKGSHPRFAIGEAMTPDTDLMMSIISHQYDIPEIAHLSSFKKICENISPSSCGLKRSFNFIYHREGQKQTLQEANKFGVHPSSHIFRQDIDHYIVKVATKYGTELLENTNCTNIDINSERIEIETEGGESFTANYLVDASGYRSPLSLKFDLRDKPTRFKTHSRSLFTHMVGVKRYDDCIQKIEESSDKLLWYQGTLHHIFDGGWMWVIPFNNHEKSTNPYCSVGLNFDSRRFPKTDLAPEQEFKDFLARFPDIAIQFEDAKPTRQWISTDRLQYSSHSCMGERFYVLPHASGFVDPLYSFGLVNTCTILIPLATQITKSLAEDNYATERFAEIENLQQKLLDYNDNLVNCSYISFVDFGLWNAWRRIWILGSFLRQTKAGLKKELKIRAGRGKELAKLNKNDLDSLTPSFEGLGGNFFQEATETVEKVEEGVLSPDEATSQIMKLINSIDFLPKDFCELGDPSQKDIDGESDFVAAEYRRFLRWVKSSKNPKVKKYFDYDMKDLLTIANRKAAKKFKKILRQKLRSWRK